MRFSGLSCFLYLTLKFRVLNLHRHPHRLFVETGLIEGLSVVDLVVVVLRVEDGQLLVAVGGVHKILGKQKLVSGYVSSLDEIC